jgi:pimeloyl-ACP methyl ester carboxylesterase
LTPLVCLHGFLDTPRSWDLVMPALERRHEVLAPTLPGLFGGPPIEGELHDALLVDAVEREMDHAGIDTAHVAGNSLGGYVALQLAARGRAQSVVAFAPAGGWPPGDESYLQVLDTQAELVVLAKAAAPQADAILATPEGRRRATQLIVSNYEHIPAELIAHQMLGVAGCESALELIAYARRAEWSLDAERIECPVRIVWGSEDRLLPWPRAAARYRDDWLPNADWVLLDGVGHSPQLDVPLEATELILGFTG